MIGASYVAKSTIVNYWRTRFFAPVAGLDFALNAGLLPVLGNAGLSPCTLWVSAAGNFTADFFSTAGAVVTSATGFGTATGSDVLLSTFVVFEITAGESLSFLIAALVTVAFASGVTFFGVEAVKLSAFADIDFSAGFAIFLLAILGLVLGVSTVALTTSLTTSLGVSLGVSFTADVVATFVAGLAFATTFLDAGFAGGFVAF